MLDALSSLQSFSQSCFLTLSVSSSSFSPSTLTVTESPFLALSARISSTLFPLACLPLQKSVTELFRLTQS